MIELSNQTKTCNSFYMQDQLKCWLFVLCSFEIIFSFLLKMSSLKALEIEFAFFFIPLGIQTLHFLCDQNLENTENLEKSGNLKNCQNLREIRIFVDKNMENLGKCKICDINVNKIVFQQTFLSRVTQGKI